MKPFVIIFSLLVSLISSILVIENNCLINRDCRSLRLFLTFLSPCMHMYIDKTWQRRAHRRCGSRHWSDVYSHCFHPPLCDSPGEQLEWSSRLEGEFRTRTDTPMRPMHSLLFSLGIFARQFRNGRETDPVRGNADCSRCVRETFWEDRFGGKWNFRGERGGKIAQFGKRIDIIVVIPLFYDRGAKCTICNNDKKVGDCWRV